MVISGLNMISAEHEVLHRAAEAAVLVGDVGGELEDRPAVVGLPEQVGQPHHQGATSPPSHSHGERRWCRAVAAQERCRPARRGGRRPRRAWRSGRARRSRRRTARGAAARRAARARRPARSPAHASMSRVCVVRRCPTVITTTEVPVMTAASTCARLSPPKRRAVQRRQRRRAGTTVSRLGSRSSTQVVPVDLVAPAGRAARPADGWSA